MRAILIYVPGVVLTLSFLRFRLAVTKEVTLNDKRVFGITPTVQLRPLRSIWTRCQLVNGEVT